MLFKLTSRFLVASIRLFCIVIILPVFLPFDVAAQSIKMTIGRAGVNPGLGPSFIAQKENLYAKHGLEANIIETNTASAVQAMLGGSMHIATGAAGGAFVTATLEGTPPFVLVSSWVNVLPYVLFARQEIKDAKDLKGKTGQIGSPFGTAPEVALHLGLAKLGLDPEKDVKLIQMPRSDWGNVLAQLERGDVQFTLLPPPYDRIAEKRGFRALLSLPEMGISWQQNGEWMQRSYLTKNREAVVRFLRVMAEATKFYFGQKEKSVGYLTEFLGSNREDTEYGYQLYAKWVDRIPRPKVEALKTNLEAIKKATPKAATADAASFIDMSLVDQLVKEGYYK